MAHFLPIEPSSLQKCFLLPVASMDYFQLSMLASSLNIQKDILEIILVFHSEFILVHFLFYIDSILRFTDKIYSVYTESEKYQDKEISYNFSET